MKAIDNYFFVAGGTLLPRLAHLVLDWLESQGAGQLSDAQRIAVYDLERALFLGRATPQEFLDGVQQIGAARTGTDRLLAELLARVRVDGGALSTADDLSRHAEVCLFSDVPAAWLEELTPRFDWRAHFSPQNMIYLADLGLADESGAVFDILASTGRLTPGHSLWVDIDPFRSAAAVRRGIDAIVYVDERRLRRELRLRKLL